MEHPITSDKPRVAYSPHSRSDTAFYLALAVIGGLYVVLIVAMLLADAAFLAPHHLLNTLRSPEIRYAIQLSLVTSTVTAILSVWVAVPLGYLLARRRFPLAWLVDAVVDIPIVLPPIVVGLSLLILFQTPAGRALEKYVQITYAVPAIILAQFSVSTAFAVRTMRVTFDGIHPRREQVALTLGCRRSQAFWYVLLPEARHGILTAGLLAWAQALGEFGPILVFAGTTRMKTEVLSTSVFLELSAGNLQGAVAVSLLMVLAAVIVLVAVRRYGSPSLAVETHRI